MSFPVNLNSPFRVDNFTPEYAQDLNATKRLRINADLATLHLAIQASTTMDPLSEFIRTWHATFQETVNHPRANLNNTITIFIDQLKDMMVSPISPFEPLAHNIFLGTDGHAYGEKTLAVYLSQVQREPGEHYRSPFSPNEERPFFVKPHPLATAAVAWLDSYHQLQLNQEIEAAYARLKNENRLPTFPADLSTRGILRPRSHSFILARHQRMQALMQQQVDQERRDRENLTQRLENPENLPVTSTVIHILNDTRAEAANVINTRAQRIERIRAEGEENIVSIQNRLHQVRQETDELQEQHVEVNRRISEVSGGINQHRIGNGRIQRGIEENRIEQHVNDRLSSLGEVLENRTREAEAPFRAFVHTLQEGMGQETGHLSRLGTTEQANTHALNNRIRQTSEDTANLHRQGNAQTADVDRLENQAQTQARNHQRIARYVNEMASEEYVRQEQLRLDDMLRQLPDPVLNRLVPFRDEMNNTFAANRARIEQLDEEEELYNLQVTILENTAVVLEEQLEELEEQNVVLQGEIDDLPEQIRHVEVSQQQLQININNTEKLIKKQQKARVNNLLKTVAIGVACAALTGGAVWAIEEMGSSYLKSITFSSVGGNGAQFSIGFAF